jgi:hypothetical protein
MDDDDDYLDYLRREAMACAVVPIKHCGAFLDDNKLVVFQLVVFRSVVFQSVVFQSVVFQSL